VSKFKKRLFFATADTTPELVYTGPANTVSELKSVTLAQPTGSAAVTVRISLGADATATRFFEYPVPAGVGTWAVPVGLIIEAGEQLFLSATAGDDVVVCTGNGTVEFITA
jgi:hypothetical protein